MTDFLTINVNEHTEKKNGLTYLSWAWAWAEVLKIDPLASWEAAEYNGYPASFSPDGSAMVKVFVTIQGHTKSCTLPVMDHRNKAIKEPDSFAVNTAIVRCMTKAIAMFGLGLYIYAGEDLPEDSGGDQAQADKIVSLFSHSVSDACEEARDATDEVWHLLPSNVRAGIKSHNALSKLSPEIIQVIEFLAIEVEGLINAGDVQAAEEKIRLMNMPDVEKKALANMLTPDALKKVSEQATKVKKAATVAAVEKAKENNRAQ